MRIKISAVAFHVFLKPLERCKAWYVVANGKSDRFFRAILARRRPTVRAKGYNVPKMQTALNLDAQAGLRLPSINIEESIQALKSSTIKLARTKSETFSYLCEETVTYGEVAATFAGFFALMAIIAVSGFLFGGEVL